MSRLAGRASARGAGEVGERHVPRVVTTQETLHRAAIEAARAAGAGRLLYTSQMGSDPRSAFPPMHTHAATEDMLHDCGVPFTSLRNGFYIASALEIFGHGLRAGEVAAPEDGPVAWTTHGDLAEAAAIAMTSDALDGISAPLTAGEALTLEQLAAIASEVTGRAVRRVVVSDAAYRGTLVAGGVPAPVTDMLVGMLEASRHGAFSRTDATLGRLIGHAPTAVKEVLGKALVRAWRRRSAASASSEPTASHSRWSRRVHARSCDRSRSRVVMSLELA